MWSTSSSSLLLHTRAPKIGWVLWYNGLQPQFPASCPSQRGRPREFSTSTSNDVVPSSTVTIDPGTDASISCSSMTMNQKYVTGTVMNYLRKKSFGFILPDGADPADPEQQQQQAIFVHRKGIKSTALLPNSVGTANPFLIRNERVRFIIVRDDKVTAPADNKAMAIDVEYEDGTQIPIYRSAYVKNVKMHHLNVLGEAVYKILQEEPDETIRRIKIKESYEQTKHDIAIERTRYDDATGKLKRAGEESLRRTPSTTTTTTAPL